MAARLLGMLKLALLTPALGEPAAASTVHTARVRVNAQDPAWSRVCPPPEDASAAASPCVNAHEAQGLPTTALRLTWELAGVHESHRGVVQTAFEADITCLRTGATLWSTNATAERFDTVALPEPELGAEGSYSARVRTAWLAAGSASDVAATWTDWSAPALFDTAPSTGSWASRESEWIGGFNQLRSTLTLPSSTAYFTLYGRFFTTFFFKDMCSLVKSAEKCGHLM